MLHPPPRNFSHRKAEKCSRNFALHVGHRANSKVRRPTSSSPAVKFARQIAERMGETVGFREQDGAFSAEILTNLEGNKASADLMVTDIRRQSERPEKSSTWLSTQQQQTDQAAHTQEKEDDDCAIDQSDARFFRTIDRHNARLDVILVLTVHSEGEPIHACR